MFLFLHFMISSILSAINERNKLKCYFIIATIGSAMSYSTNARGKGNRWTFHDVMPQFILLQEV